MTVTLGKVGRIYRKPFALSEQTVVDVLKARLKGERNVSIRRRIRQKLKEFT